MKLLSILTVGLAVVALFQTWCLARLLPLVSAVTRLEDRAARLAHSIGILTDTTEACFNAIGDQLIERRDAEPGAPRRKPRQRAIVGAARRGQTVNAIAAQESLSESEIALRLHLARLRAAEEVHDATLRS